MTSIVDDKKSDTSTIQTLEKKNTNRSLGGRYKNIRIDSPTTIRACQELGILIQELVPKTIEDFQDPYLDSDVISLRFNHYLKRFQQTMNFVAQRRKELLRARKRSQPRTLEKIQTQEHIPPYTGILITQSQDLNEIPKRITSHEINLQKATVQSTPREENTSTVKLPSLRLNTVGTMDPLMESYNRTISYLKGSHSTTGVKDFREILTDDTFTTQDTEGMKYETVLCSEIDRYNKIKRQKQKQAKDTYEQEINRLKMVEELKEREKRREEFQKKKWQDREKLEEERKLIAQEKLEQILKTENDYEKSKTVAKEKIKQKLEEKKNILKQEYEKKKKEMEEKALKREEANKVAEQKREELLRTELEDCFTLKYEIEQKLLGSHEAYQFVMFEKKQRMQDRLKRIDSKILSIKEKLVQDEEKRIHNFAEKLIYKEEEFRQFKLKHAEDIKKKQQEIADKRNRFLLHQQDLTKQKDQWVQEIKEKFSKVEENLAQKKELEEKNHILKQEESRLKILDKQENYKRNLRQMEFEQQKLLDKQKAVTERQNKMKEQFEIVQKAKMEATIQAKIEAARIDQSVNNLSKFMQKHGSTTLTPRQMKHLKGLLNPEDFSSVEEEAKRQREAEKMAREKQEEIRMMKLMEANIN